MESLKIDFQQDLNYLFSNKIYLFTISPPLSRCPESVRMSKEASPKVLSSKLLGGVDQVSYV